MTSDITDDDIERWNARLDQLRWIWDDHPWLAGFLHVGDLSELCFVPDIDLEAARNFLFGQGGHVPGCQVMLKRLDELLGPP